MKRSFLILLLAFGAAVMHAQDANSSRELSFVPWFVDHTLLVGEQQVMPDGTPVTIDRLRFFIGPVQTHSSGVTSSTNGYHLIDAEDPATWLVHPIDPAGTVPDSISFLLGVDSLTNVSGAFGGDLDPTKGMYWAWNSGYIHLKLEGSSPASPYPKGAFELHLGGYLPPYGTVQRIVLRPIGNGPWTIHVDVAVLLAAVDLHGACNVMSPGAEAARLSKKAASMFTNDVAP